MITFDLISDTHLEFYQKAKQIKPLLDQIKAQKQSSIICLAGDIGYPKMPLYRVFLENLMELYDYILVVSGNHEYYNARSTAVEIDQRIKDLCEDLTSRSSKTVIYLQKQAIEIQGHVFLGCTLWSEIHNHALVTRSMSDYKKIQKKGHYGLNGAYRHTHITTHDVNRWHYDHVQWLKEQLALYQDKPVIIITHHAPITLPEIHPPAFCNNALTEAYCTDLSELVKRPVVCWCFGHTHQSYKGQYRGVWFQNSPAGYRFENLKGLDRYFTVNPYLVKRSDQS